MSDRLGALILYGYALLAAILIASRVIDEEIPLAAQVVVATVGFLILEYHFGYDGGGNPHCP